MNFNKVKTTPNAVENRGDTYLSASLSVVSVRRPLLAPALLLSGAFVGYAAAFIDLLTASEVASILICSAILIFVSSQIGQLKLLSRDLRGSPLSNVSWDYYPRLQKRRHEIVSSLNTSQTGGNHG